jgi:hypothetical protein
MPKTLVSKSRLEQMAFVEICSLSGCHDVRSIEIGYVHDIRSDSNWKIAVVYCGVDHHAPSRAANYVVQKLRRQYNLRLDG